MVCADFDLTADVQLQLCGSEGCSACTFVRECSDNEPMSQIPIYICSPGKLDTQRHALGNSVSIAQKRWKHLESEA